jgi:hypothetical protein
MRISRLDVLAATVAIVTIADPAFAAPLPAPVAGIGIGAFVAIGVGYRALKRRIGR